MYTVLLRLEKSDSMEPQIGHNSKQGVKNYEIFITKGGDLKD